MHNCRKCIVTLRLWICCTLPKANSFISHFCKQRIVWPCPVPENTMFCSTLLLKTPNRIQKRSVMKTMQGFFLRFRRQRSITVYYSFWQKQGVIEKFEYLGEFKIDFSKMLVPCLLSINDWMMQKQYKTDYENLVQEASLFCTASFLLACKTICQPFLSSWDLREGLTESRLHGVFITG
jgi:hypothetical protein